MKTKLALEFAMQEVTKVGHTARTQKLITCATLGRVAMLILLLGVFATSSHAQEQALNASYISCATKWIWDSLLLLHRKRMELRS